jgi:hypothetical protein
MSVIRKAVGPEWVFTLEVMSSKSAFVTRLPAATAAVADVDPVMNVLRETFGV